MIMVQNFISRHPDLKCARAWSVVFPIDYTRSNHTREMLDIIYHRVLRKAILQGSNFWDVNNYLDMYEHNTLKVDFACRK